MTACADPLEPRGYMGCAASPTKVTRPNVHCATGSLSTIGYSNTSSEFLIMAGTSSQSKRQSS